MLDNLFHWISFIISYILNKIINISNYYYSVDILFSFLPIKLHTAIKAQIILEINIQHALAMYILLKGYIPQPQGWFLAFPGESFLQNSQKQIIKIETLISWVDKTISIYLPDLVCIALTKETVCKTVSTNEAIDTCSADSINKHFKPHSCNFDWSSSCIYNQIKKKRVLYI